MKCLLDLLICWRIFFFNRKKNPLLKMCRIEILRNECVHKIVRFFHYYNTYIHRLRGATNNQCFDQVIKETTKINNKLGNRQCVNVSMKWKWILMVTFRACCIFSSVLYALLLHRWEERWKRLLFVIDGCVCAHCTMYTVQCMLNNRIFRYAIV